MNVILYIDTAQDNKCMVFLHDICPDALEVAMNSPCHMEIDMERTGAEFLIVMAKHMEYLYHDLVVQENEWKGAYLN